MKAFLQSDRSLFRRITAAAILPIAVALLVPAAARAEERPKWELGIGTALYTQPDYVGSGKYHFHGIPFPWIIYRGPRLRLDRESMQTKIFGTNLVRLDLSASGQIPVNSSENDRRKGMRDLDWMLQLGPALKFKVYATVDGRQTLDVEVPLRIGLAIDTNNFSYEGLVSSPKLQYRYEPEGWRFEANAGLEFSDNDYNDYMYGVSSTYATPSRRSYDAHGGYGGVRLSAGVSRYFGPIYAGVFLRYLNTAGAAFQNSPLVATESAVIGGVAIGWVWMKSDEMVAVGAQANLAAQQAMMSDEAAPSTPAETAPADAAPADATAGQSVDAANPGSAAAAK